MEGCELEDLVREMEFAAPTRRRSDTDFARGYCLATSELISVPEAELWDEPDLFARVLRARRAAEDWGIAEDRLRVENEFAKSLIAGGKIGTASEILVGARIHPGVARRALAETLELSGYVASCAGRFEEGLACADQCSSLLDELLDEEERSSQRSWFEYHSLTRVQVLGDRTRILVSLGLPDLAAVAVASEQEAAQRLRGTENAAPAAVRAALDQALFEITVLDFGRAASICDALLTSGQELLPDERRAVRAMEALAATQRARESQLDVEPATRQLVQSLLDDKELRSDIRAELLLAEVDIELRARDFASAEAHLHEAQALLATRTGGPDPFQSAQDRDVAIAYAACLALERGVPASELNARHEELAQTCSEMSANAATLPLRPGGVGYLYWSNPRLVLSARIRCAIALHGEQRGAEEAVEIIAAAQVQATIARSLNLPPVSLAEIRKSLLAPDHGLLLYLPGCDRTHLIAIDDRDARAFELGPRGVLVNAVTSFSARGSMPPDGPRDESATAPRNDPLRESGEKLRKLLLPDDALALIARWKGFYVVGADLLAQANFERLPLPDGKSLGVEYAVARLPSLPLGVWLAQRRRSRSDAAHRSKLMVLAVTDVARSVRQRWPALDSIRLSIADHEALVAARREGAAIVLDGRDAARRRLWGDDLASVELLEIFSHGILDPSRERPLGLALGGEEDADGVLWCEDIERDFRSPPLVALFACGSGFSLSRLGDDCASQLGVSFLRRGADAVVVGQALLALGAMVELGSAFDECLTSEGSSPAEALRRARQKLAESSRWSDPFYFANVSLLGVGWNTDQRTALDPSATRHATNDDAFAWTSRLFAAAVAGAALVASAAWLRRRSLRPSAGGERRK